MAAIDRRLSAVLALALCATSARAEDRYSLSLHGYGDSDRLLVLHPRVSARAAIDEDTTLGASWDADAISAATIDVRTSASPHAFEELRNGAAFDLERALARGVRLGGGASGSISPDFGSITGTARLTLEDDSRTHTITLGASGSGSVVGRAGNQGLLGAVGDGWATGVTIGWSIVLGPELVLDLGVAGEHAGGMLESPYRFVWLYDAGDPGAHAAVPEALPDARTRGAARAGMRIALADRVFARAAYRLHADDWGVLGHTVTASLTVEPLDALRLSLDVRWLGQRGASFYRGRYETLPIVPTLRTRDRELASASTLGATLRAEVALGRIDDTDVALLADVDVAWSRMFDTPLLPERTAVSGGLGIALER